MWAAVQLPGGGEGRLYDTVGHNRRARKRFSIQRGLVRCSSRIAVPFDVDHGGLGQTHAEPARPAEQGGEGDELPHERPWVVGPEKHVAAAEEGGGPGA